MIHTVKGFGIVHKAAADAFLELRWIVSPRTARRLPFLLDLKFLQGAAFLATPYIELTFSQTSDQTVFILVHGYFVSFLPEESLIFILSA